MVCVLTCVCLCLLRCMHKNWHMLVVELPYMVCMSAHVCVSVFVPVFVYA